MDDWSISRHSYDKPRLLGEVKEEYVYLNLCQEHSFLSPSYDALKRKHVIINQSHSRMRELRESLRQAALINIVAAVNDGDKPEEKTNNKVKENLLDLDLISENGIRDNPNNKAVKNGSKKTQHSLRKPTPHHPERQKMCPKIKLSEAINENFNRQELSVLEGHQITSSSIPDKITVASPRKKKKKTRTKLGVDTEVDLDVPTVSEQTTIQNNSNKQSLSCPTLSMNQYGVIENFQRTRNLQERKSDTDSSFQGLPKIKDGNSEKKSESESESISSKDSTEQMTNKNGLHISTKNGEIGRSVGFFPPPRSLVKREIITTKRETLISKCEAIDILESSTSGDKAIIINSQRDNHGELGTCLFGLKKTSSLPLLSATMKRKKLNPKKDKEMIVFTSPLRRQSCVTPGQISDGVVGVNIPGDPKRENSDLQYPVKSSSKDQNDPPLEGRTNIGHIVIPSDMSVSSLYHLAEEQSLDTPKSSGPFSLEGRGLPSVSYRDRKGGQSNYKVTEVNSTSHVSDSESKTPVSQQIYDFQSLDSGPDPQLQPIIRKAGVTLNFKQSSYYVPRPRPINASLSASKHIDDKLSVSSTLHSEPDLSTRGQLDLSVHASRIEDADSARARSKEVPPDDVTLILKSRSSGYRGSISCSSDEPNVKDTDFLYESDSGSDVDITKIDPPKTPIMRKLIDSAAAKNQGTSSMATDNDKLTKLQVVNSIDKGKVETTVKILKSFDQDLYADFTHRKHRNSNFVKNLGDDSSKIVMVKVHCLNQEPDPVSSNQNLENSDDSDSD